MGGSVSLSVSVDRSLDTISKRVQYWSETLPDREMFVFYKGDVRESYTCRKVLQLAGKFAYRLRREYGFQKGDIIANTLPNSSERLFTDLGITLAGCICMNGVTMFSDGLDFLTSVRNSNLPAVVVCPEDNTPAWRILKPYVCGDLTSSSAHLECDLAPVMKTAILVSRNPDGPIRPFLEDLKDSPEDIFVDPDIKSDDILYIFTTSGSTGYCKLVPKTHTDIIDTWHGVQDKIKQHSRHVWDSTTFYNDRPIGWMGGFPFGTYVSADTRVLLDVFETLGSKIGTYTWSIICWERADSAIIMPLDLDNMLSQTASTGLGGYKMKIVGGGGQPIRKNQYCNYYTVADEVCALYGSTEAGFLSYGIIPETSVKDYLCQQLKPGIEMRIVDDKGKECATGQLGIIHVRGKGVFTGYLNRIQNPDPKTLTAFTKDGWLNMEDSGYFDEDRNLYVLGRLKDVIIFGSTNVYPGWLEPKIAEHPNVDEACVVPVSDPILYQNICAIVQSSPGSGLSEDELKTFCEEMFVSSREVEETPVPQFFLILENFPKTTTGKIDRVVLQKLAEERFGSK